MPKQNTPSPINPKADQSASSQPQTVQLTPAAGKRFGHSGSLLTPNITVLLDTDDLVKGQVGGFIDFLRDNAVIALAIGFVAGSQAQALVKQLIASFIDPAFQLFFGKLLSSRTVTLHFHSHTAPFAWGAFVYALLNVLFVLVTIYVIIKLFKLDRLVKPNDASKTAADESAQAKVKVKAGKPASKLQK